jgi:hypothetical protein
MAEETKTIDAKAVEGMDINGDGHISHEEMEMNLEFKRKRMEDEDIAPTYFASIAVLVSAFFGADAFKKK